LEFYLDFSRIFRKLYRQLWLIFVVTALAAAAGVAFTWNTTPDTYKAEVTLVGASNGSYSNAVGNTYIIRNYSALIRSEKIATRVIQGLPQYNLDKPVVQQMVTASFDKTADSALVFVDARAIDPVLAIDVANAAADAFVSELRNVTGADVAIIVDQASVAIIDFSGQSSQMRMRIEFAAGGFVMACVLLSLIEMFSKRISRADDCTLHGTIELLGVIPRYNID
jgi:capsular polysaccharide biosynthesis protein